jgi:hypothetical protein
MQFDSLFFRIQALGCFVCWDSICSISHQLLGSLTFLEDGSMMFSLLAGRGCRNTVPFWDLLLQ